jgi:hypothetical protein
LGNRQILFFGKNFLGKWDTHLCRRGPKSNAGNGDFEGPPPGGPPLWPSAGNALASSTCRRQLISQSKSLLSLSSLIGWVRIGKHRGSWRWQLLRRHALDVPLAIRHQNHTLKRDLGAQSAVRFRGSGERGRRQRYKEGVASEVPPAGRTIIATALVTDVLQCFPLSERRLHCHAKCMFIVFRMLFDRSMCPRNSAPTREANRVLRQNFSRETMHAPIRNWAGAGALHLKRVQCLPQLFVETHAIASTSRLREREKLKSRMAANPSRSV